MKKLKFTVAFVLVLISFSCSKKDEQVILPTGENTAYYFLNGSLKLPQGFTSGVSYVKPLLCTTCLAPDNGLEIWLKNSSEYFKLYLKDGITANGLYPLNIAFLNTDPCGYAENFASLNIRNISAGSNPDLVYSTTLNSGTVTITDLSADKRKFKGTFSATLTSFWGEVFEITNGAFNINLDTL